MDTFNMKRFVSGPLGVLALSAALLLAQPARADEPAPSGQVLGTIEALLNHCAKVDAASAARYQQRLKLMVQGADEKALAEVRTSDEYREAYQTTTDQLGDVTEEDARRTCSSSLADNN
jgi:hypothetical protein